MSLGEAFDWTKNDKKWLNLKNWKNERCDDFDSQNQLNSLK